MSEQRYSIVERLDAGGMAEVFKGKAVSMRGFEKLVAIKRVLPNLSKNEKFISMFLDEARLSLHLNHANIIQTFDVGRSDHSYFIVMEWCDGGNLKALLGTMHDWGVRISREQAVFITIEVCKGLSHAHQRRDPDGRHLEIVHRDVSPPNILLSREGEIKLVDFGLAKAASQATFTDPGVVKGKFGYLCPESAYGQKVDYRADIFSTGIVLWEMLAGRRLFEGKTDLDTVKLVRDAKIPPIRTLNPEVDEDLEAILLKALARDPRQRFQSCEEFGHELSRYLMTHQLLVTSYDIAVLVKRVLSNAIKSTTPNQILSSSANAVRGELDGFVSIEELEQMAFVAESETAIPVSAGRRTGNPVDPRGWANEFELFDGEETIIDANLYQRLDLSTPRQTPERTDSDVKVRVHGSAEKKIAGANRDEQGGPRADFGANPAPAKMGTKSPTAERGPTANHSSVAERPSISSRPPSAPIVVRNTTTGQRPIAGPQQVTSANRPQDDNKSMMTGLVVGLSLSALIIGIAWYAFL